MRVQRTMTNMKKKNTKHTRNYSGCDKDNSTQNRSRMNNKGKRIKHLVTGNSVPGTNNTAKAKPKKKIRTTAVENKAKIENQKENPAWNEKKNTNTKRRKCIKRKRYKCAEKKLCLTLRGSNSRPRAQSLSSRPFYIIILTTSAVSSITSGSILIFASCVLVPMGSDSEDDEYESPATRFTVAIAAFATHKRHTTATRIVEDEDSRRLPHVLMHKIDGSEGGDSPPRVKRTRRVFPRPTYKAPSACALRCSGAANSCEYVRDRAIAAVIIFLENFVKIQSLNSGFMIKVVNPILPV